MLDQHDDQTQTMALSDTPAIADPRGLTLVQLDQVESLPQVRTESGWDDKSLAELGESIKTLGLLQLPLLRWDAMRNAYIIIAGHRRIEAMRRAGFPGFYAITGQADQAQAHLMQLTENIHREQLTTKETAYALRTLSDQGHNLAKIAAMVNKSKPWVSKHLSVTHPDFGTYARKLFESCEVEDLEILNSLSQAEKAATNAGYIGENWTANQRPAGGKAWTRKAAAACAKAAKQLTNYNAEPNDENEADDEQTTGEETSNAATPSDDEKAAARRLQDAMVSLIGAIKDGKEIDARGALAWLIGYACGHEAERLSGTRQALTAMLK